MMRWSRRRTSTSRWPIRPRATCKPSSTPQTQRSRASNCSWPWPLLSPSWESSSGPSASRWAGGCPAVNGRRHELSNRAGCRRRHPPRTLRRRRPRRRPRPICGFHAPRGQRAPADRAEPGDDHPLGGGPIRHRDHPRDERDGIPLRCPSRDGLVGRPHVERIVDRGWTGNLHGHVDRDLGRRRALHRRIVLVLRPRCERDGLRDLAAALERRGSRLASRSRPAVDRVPRPRDRLRCRHHGEFHVDSRRKGPGRPRVPGVWRRLPCPPERRADRLVRVHRLHGGPLCPSDRIRRELRGGGPQGFLVRPIGGGPTRPRNWPVRLPVPGLRSIAWRKPGAVLAGGIVLAVLLVGTLDALVTSPYGWVILAKVGLFAPMLALGAYNRYRLVPKTAESERPTEAVRRIVGNVRFETSLGIAVLVLAGLLTSMTPAAAVPAGPAGPSALDLVKDGLKAHSEFYPPPTTVGASTLTLLLNYASNGTPFYLARNGTAQFTLTDPPRPPVKENLSGPHGNPSNHFSITTTALSSPGVWKIDLNFRRLDSFDLRVTFYVTIKAGG